MLHADILIPIIAFLDPRHQLVLATLFRLDSIQASAFIALQERALDVASSRNDVRLLGLLVAHCKTTKTADPHYTHRAIDQACAMGHLEILDCWKESGLRLKYSPAAMDDPSRAGHVSVLQWWKDSRLKIKYSVRAVDGASRNGQVPVLEWWKDSGYHMKYSVAAVDGVLWGQSLDVLQWWERSGLELRVTERRVVSQSPWSDKYRWWMAHRARINRRRGVDPNTVDWAVTSGRLDVLQVWLDAGVSFRCTRFAIHTASARGMVNVLQWWKDKGLPFAYSYRPLDCADNLYVLQWWKDSGLELRYSWFSMDIASRDGNVEVLQWWKDSGLPMKYSIHAILLAWLHKREASLEWWRATGLNRTFDVGSVRPERLHFGPFSGEYRLRWKSSRTPELMGWLTKWVQE